MDIIEEHQFEEVETPVFEAVAAYQVPVEELKAHKKVDTTSTAAV
jgi:hypothetical protein